MNFISISDIGRLGYGLFMNNKFIVIFRNFLIEGWNDNLILICDFVSFWIFVYWCFEGWFFIDLKLILMKK